MQTTDTGEINILLSSMTDTGSDDSIPSGVWEYDSNIGLYHKYSISPSVTTDFNLSDLWTNKNIISRWLLFLIKPIGLSLQIMVIYYLC